MSENKPILELDKVSMNFGGLRAVDELSFRVDRKEIVGLIGPNGAGKTTVFNCVTQFYKNYEGNIYTWSQDGGRVDLRSVAVTDVINYGLVRTFQNLELVRDLSVLENVLIGAHTQFRTGIFQHILRTRASRREEAQLREKALDVLDFLRISHLKETYVAGQPYGIMKKIEIARTLMSQPQLIILDEPAAGLNDKETDELEELIYAVRDRYDTGVLLIEHDMGFVMNICNRVCAINFGKFLAMDTAERIQKNELVQEAYLGKEA